MKMSLDAQHLLIWQRYAQSKVDSLLCHFVRNFPTDS